MKQNPFTPYKRMLLLAALFAVIAAALLFVNRTYFGFGSGYGPKEYLALQKEMQDRKKSYQASLRDAPPTGYLIPPSDFMPQDYKFAEKTYRDKSARYHYYKDKYKNDGILNISDSGTFLDTNNETFENYIQQEIKAEPHLYRIDKKFTYNGFPGVVMGYYYWGFEDGAGEYWLRYNYQGRLVTIHTTDTDLYNPDSLYTLLTTLVPAP